MHPTSRPPQSHRSSCCWGRKTPLQHLAGASRSIWARLFQAAEGELAASPGLSRCQFSFLFVNFFRSRNAGSQQRTAAEPASRAQHQPEHRPSVPLPAGASHREHEVGEGGWKTPRVITPCVGIGQERAPVGNGCPGRVQGAWGSL